jgi:hypothetical protein
MTVACVLRSGGDFDADWVHALCAGVAEHLSQEHRFVCLTDMDVPGVETIPLEHGWPGWFSKMGLFRPFLLDGLNLYLDLDTVPVGPLDIFASYAGGFAMLNDLYQGRKRAQSGVMLLRPSAATAAIWLDWTQDPEGHMRRFRGDGEWLDRHTEPDRLQDLYPGRIVSLKREGRNGPPEGCSLVCGHGRPRLSDPKAGWAHELWRERCAA